jgi:hypothetical protein
MNIRSLFTLLLALFLEAKAFTQEALLEGFTTNDPTGTVFRREGKGFRLRPPDPSAQKAPARANSHWQLGFPLALEGNFEVIVRFEVERLGPKEGPPPFKSNAEMLLKMSGIEGHYAINVASDAQVKEGPNCFKISRVEPFNQTLHYHIVSFPRKSNKGRIGLRREGSQLIYLAADGPEAPLKELIRFPYDSRLKPQLGLAAFQGSGSTLMPVNVLFSEFGIKAEQLLRGELSQTTFVPSDGLSDCPVVLNYDGQPARFLSDTSRSNDRLGVFKVEGNAIRVQPPASATHQKGVNAHWFRYLKYEVAGDFEWSAWFDIKTMGPPAKEGYGSVACCLAMQTEGALGAISFGRGCARGSGQGYSLTRSCPSANGTIYETLRFPTQADQGRLIVRRTGEQIDFLVEEEKGGATKPLYRTFAIMDPAMKFRVLADQGGTNAGPIDLLWSQMKIKAHSLRENGRLVETTQLATHLAPDLPSNLRTNAAPDFVANLTGDGAEVQTPSRFWLYAILGGGAVSGFLACIVLVMRKNRI